MVPVNMSTLVANLRQTVFRAEVNGLFCQMSLTRNDGPLTKRGAALAAVTLQIPARWDGVGMFTTQLVI